MRAATSGGQITLAASCALLVACASTSGTSPETDTLTSSPADEAPLIAFSTEEHEALRTCASSKLGLDFDVDLLAERYAAPENTEPETAWETERWARSYEQCLFELFEDRILPEDPHWEMTFRHAYALDPDGNPVMDDPLALWTDQEPSE